MSFIDDTVSTAKELFETASQKTTEAVEVQKIRLAIAKKRSELSKRFETLGRAYYQTRTGQPDDEGLASLSDEVKTLLDELRILKEQLAAAKKVQVCPVCGKDNPNGSLYCNSCGAALRTKGE